MTVLRQQAGHQGMPQEPAGGRQSTTGSASCERRPPARVGFAREEGRGTMPAASAVRICTAVGCRSTEALLAEEESIVTSFVACFRDPVSASAVVEHLRYLHIPTGDQVTVRDGLHGDLTVAAQIRHWDLRVVLDTVARYGGRMVSTSMLA